MVVVITPRGRILLDKLIVAQVVKNLPPMEPRGSLLCIHYAFPLVPILSQINLVHTLTLYSFQIHFIIISTSTPRFSKWCFPFRLAN